VNCYSFIEAEKAQQRNVKRACGLLKVSRAALLDRALSSAPARPDRKRPSHRWRSRRTLPGRELARPLAGAPRAGAPACITLLLLW